MLYILIFYCSRLWSMFSRWIRDCQCSSYCTFEPVHQED